VFWKCGGSKACCSSSMSRENISYSTFVAQDSKLFHLQICA